MSYPIRPVSCRTNRRQPLPRARHPDAA